MINPIGKIEKQILTDAGTALENIRLDIEVKVINNEIEKLPVHMIIKRELADADLIFLG